ncbi:MAG TPA: ferrochelatase [Acidimicrobiales bacterium]|nr:ferrochelatase [Acidimicrobiales bacterium]
MAGYDAFLLVSFGGPERAEEVMPFLERVTAGRGIPKDRLAAVAEHYYQAGGASPLNARCRELLAALDNQLAEIGIPTYWGNRNWYPMLEDTVAQMRDDGVTQALAFVTSAYGGYSSCRQYLDDIARAQVRAGVGAPEIHKLRLFYNHPGWVAAWADSLGEAIASARGQTQGGKPERVLFSAHSIPLPMARTSPYADQVKQTAELVAASAGLRNWELVWQSRSGNPALPWLGPDINETMQRSGPSSFVVAPIGFVCENMEVVHDLDVEAARTARKRGADFVRAASVSNHPVFVDMVCELVRERISGAPPRSVGPSGPWGDFCPGGHCPAPSHAPGEAS